MFTLSDAGANGLQREDWDLTGVFQILQVLRNVRMSVSLTSSLGLFFVFVLSPS